MRRTKPIIKADVIGNIDIEPINGVEEYTVSKQQNEFHHKVPNWDSPGESGQLLLINKKRENDEMLVLQQQMEDDKKLQQAADLNRIRKMCHEQKYLRQRFVSLNSFAKDCEDKLLMAQKKVNEEIEAHVKLRQNIANVKEPFAEMLKFREILKATNEEYLPYEKVLQDVVNDSEIFESIEDCASRCDALMIAQDEIVGMDKLKLSEIEEMRKHMIKVTNQASLTVLGLKNELSALERSYNNAKIECLKWEKILAVAKATVEGEILQKDRSVDGVNHIYRLLCRRRNKDAYFAQSDLESQLDFIKNEFELLSTVVEKYNSTKPVDKAEGYKGNVCG